VEAQPEDSEEGVCPPFSFVSSPAENVDDESKGLEMELPKRRFWMDCCLF